ncbi:transcriptional regulator [Nocardioides sp. YIM 152315]|uniref:transcriptional regulator n=1 Tax=Nocardioides sp. YIM 152315 TaxID=3031760 RepID=UPI0023DAC5A7|nr:transcriptional regulator [Nocardioides sp. YIM 152315]MDF1605808.1 transcriptional regulator [Nocardioides sp. YIM 152315]
MKSASQRDRATPDLDGFDPVIHAPIRLRLCAALDASDEVEFGAALEILDVSKSVLSKHVATLVSAGYVEQRRAVRDTRQRVWLRLAPAGRIAYRDHVAALRAIVRAAPETPR